MRDKRITPIDKREEQWKVSHLELKLTGFGIISQERRNGRLRVATASIRGSRKCQYGRCAVPYVHAVAARTNGVLALLRLLITLLNNINYIGE